MEDEQNRCNRLPGMKAFVTPQIHGKKSGYVHQWYVLEGGYIQIVKKLKQNSNNVTAMKEHMNTHTKKHALCFE